MTYKLTTRDKNFLLSIGYLPKDMEQIESGINIGTYILCKRYKETTEYQEKPLTYEEVIRRVGKRKFLSSCGRASFHWSTTNTLKECSEPNNPECCEYSDCYIYYDFSELFTEEE